MEILAPLHRSEPAGREFILTAAEFASIVNRVRETTGIVLGETKRDLVYGRLGRRLRARGCTSFADYLALLDSPEGEDEQTELVNAITTNLTSFFREPHHFEALAKTVLPGLAQAPGRRLRIWSAACSSGEEPYSIAMVVQKTLPDLARWDARILATDIDTGMIAASRAGVYELAKTAAIPREMARGRMAKMDADTVEMSQELKELIRFRPLNLLGPWPFRGTFDVIFCRNVVIYFDKETQRRLFDRFADALAPGGWLFIGHSESLFRVCDRFQHLGRTIYRKTR